MTGAGWWWRLAASLLLAWLAFGWNAPAASHPMPESLVWIDAMPDGMRLTARLPLNRLEFAFGQNLTEHPETVLARHGDALAAYLLQHVGARSGQDGWQVMRPQLEVVDIGNFPELHARFVLRAPAGTDARAPELLYDVITHEVRTHRVQVFLRSDWSAGLAGEAPVLVGELSHGRNALALPLGPARPGGGFASLFEAGCVHIAEGTDHLLFLLLLLLVAPLAAPGRRWEGLRTRGRTLRHTALVITAFTVGHSVTLVLGSLRLLSVPPAPVETAVAVTIAIAGVHAWRPLFGRAEAWMALGFGLVHGMAFSASLSGAGLTAWQHAQALLAFNLGIEVMQLLAVFAVLPPLLMLGSGRPAWYAHVRRGFSLLAVLIAVAWVAERTGSVALGEQAWLGDGSLVPFWLTVFLWILALLQLVLARPSAGKAAGPTSC